jgi:hypothetical protein
MSEQRRVNVQKEILDQVQRHYQKQQEEAAQKKEAQDKQDPESPKSDPDLTKENLEKPRKIENRYEPNQDFYKIFSDLIGGRPVENKKPVVQSMQRPEAKVTNAIESIIFKGSSPEGNKVKQDQRVDESKSSEPSIFERLGHWAAPKARKTQDSEAELEDSEVNIEFSGETETDNRSEPSIFERLSHGAEMKEQGSEVNIESHEEMKSEKPSAPSMFERLGRGGDVKAQEEQSSEPNIEFDEKIEASGEEIETDKKSEPSIFERMAHAGNVKEENSEAKADSDKKKEKKEPSLYERLGSGFIENKRSK